MNKRSKKTILFFIITVLLYKQSYTIKGSNAEFRRQMAQDKIIDELKKSESQKYMYLKNKWKNLNNNFIMIYTLLVLNFFISIGSFFRSAPKKEGVVHDKEISANTSLKKEQDIEQAEKAEEAISSS